MQGPFFMSYITTLLYEEGVTPLRRQDMAAELPGAQDQSERSEASTDKLIA